MGGWGENVNRVIWKIIFLPVLFFLSVDAGGGLLHKNCLVVFEKQLSK